VIDAIELVIRLRQLNLVENFENLFVVVLHVDQAQLLPFVFTDELGELLTVFNFIETFDELVCKILDPLDILLFDFDESLPDLILPLGDQVDVWRVFRDCAAHKALDLFKVFQIVFVLLVDILKIFAGNQALQALISVFHARVESRRGVVQLAVDAKRTLRELLLSIEQERLIDDVLIDVTFHVYACFLLSLRVNHRGDNIEGRRVVSTTLRHHGRLGSL